MPPNSVSIGSAIGTSCSANVAAENDFGRDCADLSEGTTQETTNALGSIAIDQISSQNEVVTENANLQGQAIATRLFVLRAARETPVYALNGDATPAGGAASADAAFGRFGVFFSVNYLDAKVNNDTFATGYDADGYGAAGGLDYRISPAAYVGLLVSYVDRDVDYNGSAGKMDVSEIGIALYGSYYLDNGLFLDARLGYGRGEYKMKRKIRYSVAATSTSVSNTAKSDPNGDRYSASIGAGYNLGRGAWEFIPSARLEYIRNEVDSFNEKISGPSTAPGSAWAESLDSENYDSFTSNLRGDITYAVSTRWGVLKPQGWGEWIHEFENDQQSIDGTFIQDVSNTGWVVRTRKPDRDYFHVGAGASMQFAGGRSGFVSVDKALGYDDIDYYRVQAGVRMEF